MVIATMITIFSKKFFCLNPHPIMFSPFRLQAKEDQMQIVISRKFEISTSTLLLNEYHEIEDRFI